MKQLKNILCMLVLATSSAACSATPAITKAVDKSNRLPAYTSLQDDTERARHHDVAYFAGGCFWGMQDSLNQIPGVVSTLAGYCGGKTKAPTYETVCRHDTGHAETVRVVYDPSKVTYTSLAQDFLDLHDPTTLNRQGPDIGDQYRSAIFYSNPIQKADAQAAIERKTQQGGQGYRVVTSLENFKVFYTAEDYHQDYIARTGNASCHVH